MSTIENITNRINSIQDGVLFSYSDFKFSADSMDAMAAAFSRLAAKGKIKRFGKGKYYKPKKGTFGEVPLSENQILNSILKKNDKLTGYITGTFAYNSLGLTTQIPNEYIVATSNLRKPIVLGRIKVRFVKSYCEVEENNIPLLQLLDAMKDFKNIPGTNSDSVIELLKIKLKNLSPSEWKRIIQMAINYPPSTRALLGALMELSAKDGLALKLYKSLNPLSSYNLNISSKILPNKEKWKIE